MTVREQVEQVLATVPETRGNDKRLIVEVLRRYYNVKNVDDLARPDVPPTETIRRARQKIVAGD